MAQALTEILNAHRQQLQAQRQQMVTAHAAALRNIDTEIVAATQAIDSVAVNPDIMRVLRRVGRLGLLPVLARDMDTQGD